MGLFDWLKRTTSTVVVGDDVIWLSRKAKGVGMSSAIAASLAAKSRPAAILLVAHFEDCRTELKAVAEAGRFDSGSVMVLLANGLKGSAAVASGFDESATVEIIVGERHPLPKHDEAVIEFAQSLPCRSRLIHHVSLEDAYMRVFAGEWVESVLRQLGMKEDEPIESSMVARRIKTAQQKIESAAVGDIAADSAEQWMELNCPELWRKTEK